MLVIRNDLNETKNVPVQRYKRSKARLADLVDFYIKYLALKYLYVALAE